MTSVSVIVPALNAAATLEETLAGLASQDLERDAFEVIVIDNGSKDETARVAEDGPIPTRVLRQPRERAGSARNRGAAMADSPILAFTDADCRPAPGWLRAGVEAMAGVDLVQGAVRPDPHSPRMPFDRTLWVGSEYGLYETANLFVSRQLFEQVGGFDDVIRANVSAPFGEDTWFAWRARRAGARTSFCAEALVHHAVFRRRWDGYVSERLRLAHFPALAAQIPELRSAFFYRRAFLSPRSAAFDVALLGLLAAATRRSALPLATMIPYARILEQAVRRWGRYQAPAVAAVEVAADATGLVALAAGSVRWRSLVI